MGLTNYLFAFPTDGVLSRSYSHMNGFVYGAVTTLYMAFYVDSLAPDENRNHAMGYYVGSWRWVIHGNFFGGLIADHWGYAWTFQFGALLSLVSVGFFWFLHGPSGNGEEQSKRKERQINLEESFKALLDPELATVVLVALFLNLLHQMGGVFISLYALGVGMSLTQIGIIRAAYAGCNAVTRPISGHVVNKVGHKGLSYFGLPLQSMILMLVPLFSGFGTNLLVYVASGLLRAIVVVANAVGLVQDVPEAVCVAAWRRASITPPATWVIFLDLRSADSSPTSRESRVSLSWDRWARRRFSPWSAFSASSETGPNAGAKELDCHGTKSTGQRFGTNGADNHAERQQPKRI